jgi:hypothetical protein
LAWRSTHDVSSQHLRAGARIRASPPGITRGRGAPLPSFQIQQPQVCFGGVAGGGVVVRACVSRRPREPPEVSAPRRHQTRGLKSARTWRPVVANRTWVTQLLQRQRPRVRPPHRLGLVGLRSGARGSASGRPCAGAPSSERQQRRNRAGPAQRAPTPSRRGQPHRTKRTRRVGAGRRRRGVCAPLRAPWRPNARPKALSGRSCAWPTPTPRGCAQRREAWSCSGAQIGPRRSAESDVAVGATLRLRDAVGAIAPRRVAAARQPQLPHNFSPCPQKHHQKTKRAHFLPPNRLVNALNAASLMNGSSYCAT